MLGYRAAATNGSRIHASHLTHQMRERAFEHVGERKRGAPVGVVAGLGQAGELSAGVGLVLLLELQRRDPAAAHDVVNLLGNLIVAQGGQVAEGLEEAVAEGAPDLHLAVLLGIADGAGGHHASGPA